ncbi:MAG: hypothetical protein LBI01_03845 [Elusimicrobium sp.]|jgi:hypothetical protein|nr:hypothetical protein [Elusimicrobium sp.]
MKSGLTRLQMIFALVLVLIFAGLSVPKIIDIPRKTSEGQTKYNLERLRSAIAAYYGDNRGTYPEDDLSVLVPRYIEKIPYEDVYGYEKSNKVNTKEFTGKGGWFYFNRKDDPRWGDIIADLSGYDSSGKKWAEN